MDPEDILRFMDLIEESLSTIIEEISEIKELIERLD